MTQKPCNHCFSRYEKTSIIGLVNLVGTRSITAKEYRDWHATGKWAGMILQVKDMSRTYWAYDFKNPRRLNDPIKVVKIGRAWTEINNDLYIFLFPTQKHGVYIHSIR